jgi:NAD(P)-dependent dehydrogenase (short-subunit alcohol dehydrogenase family)
MDPMNLTGKRVVIVGGTSGMGQGAARAAEAAGAEVIVAGRRAQPPLDFTDEVSVKKFFDAGGAFDHLLVTAAPSPGPGGGFLQQDLAAAQAYMNGKFFGSWACARYAAPHLRAGGSITFLTGCASIRPRAGSTMVTATFAALEAFSQALALELGPIRVNTIRPGLVDSDMWGFLDPAAREQLRERTRQSFPARRIGTVDDIGHAAVFLMTNPYVTGAILEVSGGESLVAL